ncbi:MAG: hypothetical protein M0R80_00635 [Proteobacteria bacterium]|jgi:hypothetical protein|nr:hypothetical protein [Pseudomonadota bacterium]
MRILGNGTGKKLRSKNSTDLDFELSNSPYTNLISGSSSTARTVKDLNLQEYVDATYDNLTNLLVTPGIGCDDSPLYYSSADVSIATIDQNGTITQVGNGTGKFNVTWKGLTKQTTAPISRVGGGTTEIFISYVDGSLGKHCSDNVDTRIAGKTRSCLPLFTTMDHTTPHYVRNTNCWLSGISNVSCISPWNSNGGKNQAGTLISPRHIAFAEHYQFGAGTVIRYITDDDQVVEKTVLATQSIGPPNYADMYFSDITIGVLDSDIPPTIKFAKLLPTNWANYLPSFGPGTGSLILDRIPGVATNQLKEALVGDYVSTHSVYYPENSQRQLLYSKIIGGDSGSPGFIIIHDELVFLTTWTTPGGGPQYLNYLSEINAAMASLSNGRFTAGETALGHAYTLTHVDLSDNNPEGGFTDFTA